MKIEIIRPGHKPAALRLPTALFLNRLTALIILKCLKRKGIGIPKEAFLNFLTEIKRYSRTHADWTLIEVLGADNTGIRIGT